MQHCHADTEKALGTRTADRQRRVIEHLPLVHREAWRVARCVPANVELDDLISAGCEGLLNAVQRFDPGRGLSFGTFAHHRVRGAILDELRGLDSVSRGKRRMIRSVQRAQRELTAELGQTPSPEQVAARVGLDLEQLEDLRFEQHRTRRISLDTLAEGLGEKLASPGSSAQPEQALLDKELKQRVARALDRLPARQQTVLACYYCERMTYQAIADLFEVTESRICQIHRAAVQKLRAWLDAEEQGRPARACA